MERQEAEIKLIGVDLRLTEARRINDKDSIENKVTEIEAKNSNVKNYDLDSGVKKAMKKMWFGQEAKKSQQK